MSDTTMPAETAVETEEQVQNAAEAAVDAAVVTIAPVDHAKGALLGLVAVPLWALQYTFILPLTLFIAWRTMKKVAKKAAANPALLAGGGLAVGGLGGFILAKQGIDMSTLTSKAGDVAQVAKRIGLAMVKPWALASVKKFLEVAKIATIIGLVAGALATILTVAL